ncbi:MFS transporter [Salipaludibacillus agaradhaerens]|uniref:MFS transporter n=1 Tax=Salipaludibacillus agaradhaerens TaxID=76935 RepID=A0A9Q4B4G1_SALAG|nr:MFS transporter [Salipaludibacillus agaradhaerens]MCR6098159.1 MFS transporter [Salipaludibacillus agaradhaerens]MCR6116211.1 MFS transporter [Salipaludibacillus agaradhaerens]
MNGAMSWPFLRLYLLVLFYFSANAILNVFIPLRGEALGATNTTIGIIMGAYLFTTMFFRPWAGQIIQKHGPLKVLRFILIFNGLALILYTITGLGGYLIARMMQGVSTAFFSMALQIGIIDALPEEDRSQGISLYSLFSYIPGIIGPLLAIGIWQGGMGYFAIVMVTIAMLTGLFGFSANVDTPKTQPMTDQAHSSGSIVQSLSQLVKNPDLCRSSAFMLVGSLIFGATTIFIPLYAVQVDKGNAGIFLMIMAATVVFARFTLRKRIPSDGKWHAPFMIGTMLLLALGSQSVSIAIYGGAFFFYIGAVLIGTAQALLYPTLTTYLSFVLPEASRNVLLGLFIAMADLGVSLGGIIMGPVADMLSYSWMYMVCAILSVAILGVVVYDRKKVVVQE